MAFKKIGRINLVVLFALIITSVAITATSFAGTVHAAVDDSDTMMMMMADDTKMMADDTKMQSSSPSAQYRNGVFLSAIQCTAPNELYVRDNVLPVCLQESTYDHLLERGLNLTPYEASSASGDTRVVTVGSLLPLTGGASGYGQDMSEGSTMAVADFNALLEERGENWRLDVQSYDTMTNPDVLKARLADLNEQGIKIVIGPSIDLFDTQNVVEYANTNDMLLFSCCSVVLSNAVSDDALFRMIPDQSNHGKAVAEVMRDAGIKTVITASRDAEWITDLTDSAEDRFVELGGHTAKTPIRYNVLGEFDGTHTQMLADAVTAQLESFESKDVGVLFVGFEETFDFLETASSHEVLSNVRWFGADANTIIHDNLGGLEFAEQINFVSVQPTVPDSDIKTRLAESTSAALGRASSVYAFFKYDAVQLVGRSILEAQSTSAPDVIKAIPQAAQEYVGASGSTITFNEAGDRTDIRYAVWNLNNGVWHIGDVVPAPTISVNLTDEEKAWLESHHELKVTYNPNWSPIEYIDESGNLAGLTPQFMSILEQSLKVDLVRLSSISSFTETLENLKNGTAEIGFFLANTPERSQYMAFTEPYLHITTDVVTMGSEPVSPEDLAAMRVATVKNYAIESWLDANHPEINYISMDDVPSGILMLESGQVDAFLGVWPVISYNAELLQVEGLYNAGPTGYAYNLSMGYRDDQPILGSILQKVIDAAPDGTFDLSQLGK